MGYRDRPKIVVRSGGSSDNISRNKVWTFAYAEFFGITPPEWSYDNNKIKYSGQVTDYATIDSSVFVTTDGVEYTMIVNINGYKNTGNSTNDITLFLGYAVSGETFNVIGSGPSFTLTTTQIADNTGREADDDLGHSVWIGGASSLIDTGGMEFIVDSVEITTGGETVFKYA